MWKEDLFFIIQNYRVFSIDSSSYKVGTPYKDRKTVELKYLEKFNSPKDAKKREFEIKE